jgi:hypothetical protein
VIDADTGAFKRYWGAYGNKPDDALGRPTTRMNRPRSSTAARCIAPTCRSTTRVRLRPAEQPPAGVHARGQVRQRVFIAKKTRGDGAIWDVAFSKDPQQKYIYIADGKNERVYVLCANRSRC